MMTYVYFLQAGRTIIENIVSCLEQSRSCVVVMSRDYAKSEWCRFEALMALQLFQVYTGKYIRGKALAK